MQLWRVVALPLLQWGSSAGFWTPLTTGGQFRKILDPSYYSAVGQEESGPHVSGRVTS